MKIQLKLYASLKEFLPADTRGNVLEIEVDEGVTPAQLIERFHLPPKLTHLVLVNGHYIPPEKRDSVQMQDGDALAIWPPIAGG